MFLENSYFMQLAKTEKPQNWVFLVIHELVLQTWLEIPLEATSAPRLVAFDRMATASELDRDDYCDGGDVITDEVDS